MYVCVYIYVCIYIYIVGTVITNSFVMINTSYIYIYIHTYIHVYIYRERELPKRVAGTTTCIV